MRILVAFFVLCLSASAANYYVVVAGLGGTSDYETQFGKWAADLDRELKKNGDNAHVTSLSGTAVSKVTLERLFAQLGSEVQPDDSLALLLIGHGTFDGVEYKFNIPGPDPTAADLARLLDQIRATRQVVINMTSCSGASVPALSHKGRIVITATKSGTEKNATLFPRFFTDALADPAADMDKNGTLSLLEAYQYTERKLAAYYDTEKLLPTEHALFNGDRKGADSPDMQLAAAFPLLRPPTENANAVGTEKQALLRKKEGLEAQIDRLKYQKAALDEEVYRQQLTALLLQLARTQSELDR